MKKEQKEDEDLIKKTLLKYGNALNNNDFEGWLSIWAEDGVQLPPNTPARFGKQSISNGNKPGIDSNNWDFKLKGIDLVKVSGNIGVTICTYSVILSPKNGGEKIIAEPDGKALTIYEKQPDGTWKLLYDCFNTNIAP